MNYYGSNQPQPYVDGQKQSSSHPQPTMILGVDRPSNPIYFSILAKRIYSKFHWRYFCPPRDIRYPPNFKWHPIPMFATFCAGVLNANSWYALRSDELWHHLPADVKLAWLHVTKELNDRATKDLVPPRGTSANILIDSSVSTGGNHRQEVPGPGPVLDLEISAGVAFQNYCEATISPISPSSDLTSSVEAASMKYMTIEEWFEDCTWMPPDVQPPQSDLSVASAALLNYQANPKQEFFTTGCTHSENLVSSFQNPYARGHGSESSPQMPIAHSIPTQWNRANQVVPGFIDCDLGNILDDISSPEAMAEMWKGVLSSSEMMEIFGTIV